VASAFDDAVRLHSRRPLTRQELCAKLRARGHAEEAIADALARLADAYGADDASVALAFVTARGRERGRDRVVGELVARGVPEEAASAAWSQARDEGAIDPEESLARAVRRRLGAPPGRARRARLARVYNALLSEGWGREPVEAALAPYGLERIDP
jgi:SOS response regulatory protein OraA/RecX